MLPLDRILSSLRALECWNWKCALMSATVRSCVYAAAMARAHPQGSLAVAAVEMVYTTLTAGLYAGLQQRALGLRYQPLGALLIVAGVPGLSQVLDYAAHWLAGAVAPPRATLAMGCFTLLSAFFHLFAMRRGAFLTGRGAGSLLEDFKRMPALTLRFAIHPFAQGARLLAQMPTAGLTIFTTGAGGSAPQACTSLQAREWEGTNPSLQPQQKCSGLFPASRSGEPWSSNRLPPGALTAAAGRRCRCAR